MMSYARIVYFDVEDVINAAGDSFNVEAAD